MFLYKVESSHYRYDWTSEFSKANDTFGLEIDYIMGEGDIEEDDEVTLFKVDLYDVFEEYEEDIEIEDIMDDVAKPFKVAKFELDETAGNPREDGYDFDFYVSPVITECEEDENEQRI